MATKVKNAVEQTILSAVNRFSATTFTNTSIEVLCVHVTNASTQIESPSFTGVKKSTESVEAVTTGFRQCLTAAIAATSSICAIKAPPNKVPYVFVSGGKTWDVFTVNELEQGFSFIVKSSIQVSYHKLKFMHDFQVPRTTTKWVIITLKLIP